MLMVFPKNFVLREYVPFLGLEMVRLWIFSKNLLNFAPWKVPKGNDPRVQQ